MGKENQRRRDLLDVRRIVLTAPALIEAQLIGELERLDIFLERYWVAAVHVVHRHHE